MSRLFLIRHGQASFLEENYDKLSVLGEKQARLLGEYWAQQRVAVDQVYSGPRTRQLAIEWNERDGSRWIATVPLTMAMPSPVRASNRRPVALLSRM